MGSLNFEFRMSDPAGREALKTRLAALRTALARRDTAKAVETFTALDHELPDFVGADERTLLTKMLAWGDEDNALASRLHSLHSRMAEGSRILASSALGEREKLDLIAAALDHWAEAAKWEQISLNQEPAQRLEQLHALYRLAVSLGGAAHQRRMMVNGSWSKVAIEALYVRALMLRRLAGGQLNVRQVAILDCWLLAWVDALRLLKEDPAPRPRLVVQPDSNAGLALVARSMGGAALYLALDPLEAGLGLAFEALQVGELYPGVGPSATFRLEDHMALYDALQREFTQTNTAPAGRDPRNAVEGTQVDVYVGLGDVFRNGFARTHDGARAAPATAFEPVLARQPRRFALRDRNESGLGLVAPRDEAAALQPGDLLGVRVDPTLPCVLCEIVRKVTASSDGDTLLGTRVISREGLPLYLKREGSPPDAAPDVEAFYIPGTDSSGSADSLLISEAVFQGGGVLLMRETGRTFRLSVNRGRRHGRGWVLGGLEFVAEGAPARSRAPKPPEADGLTLSLVE
jgi:hypothetical protein